MESDAVPVPVVAMIKKVVPEASVVKCDIFHDSVATRVPDTDSECESIVNTSETKEQQASVLLRSEQLAIDNLFSPTWIKHEAIDLLHRIQQDAPTDKMSGDRRKVLLAGYGFGRLVVKQVTT